MLPRPTMVIVSGFNPRPPLPRGDARQLLARITLPWPVSIHAPRCRGAMLTRSRPCWSIIGFQSTPPVAEGRCRAPPTAPRIPRSFNPRPPLPRGDARQRRQCWFRSTCFNPRPPLQRGDAQYWSQFIVAILVSIHAPRCRGAMLRLDALSRPL